MKNINNIPLSEEAKKRLSELAAQYRRNARIYISIVRYEEAKKRLIVRVEQKGLINERLLKQSELTERVREMFAGEIPAEWVITVSAVDYDRDEIANINNVWIKNKMQLYGLKSKDIVNRMGYEKSVVSNYLSGARALSQSGKAAFYYFFKYYELAKFED